MELIDHIINSKPLGSIVDILNQCKVDGLFLEFGVYSGTSLNIIANNTNNMVYGFDSFEGLPEAWYDLNKGHFSCDIPTFDKKNITLVKGFFDQSIPEFLKTNNEKVAFMHIDCDLYSSTKCVFNNFKDRFQNGSIIVFDELYNYGGELWREHEYKAFKEFLDETKYEFECIGKYGTHMAGFKIII
jgi:hypothetical protein